MTETESEQISEEVVKETSTPRQPIVRIAIWFGLVLSPLIILYILFVIIDLFADPAQGTITIDPMGLLYRSILWGSFYLSMAIGLTLGYKIFKFANFAVGEYFLMGGYVAVYMGSTKYLQSTASNPNPNVLWFALFMAFIVCGLYAILVDIIVFRPLRNRGSSQQTLMISSLGVSLATRAIIAMRFGSANMSFFTTQGQISSETQSKVPTLLYRIPLFASLPSVDLTYSDGSPTVLIINQIDVITMVTLFTLVVLFFVFLKGTKVGKAMRATASNPDLAAASGISTTKIYNISSFIIGGIAGVGGVLYVAKLGIGLEDAIFLIIPAFAVVVLGSVGSLIGALVATYIVGFARVYSSPILSGLQEPTERSNLKAYVDIVPFFLLVLVLLVHNQGIGLGLEKRFNKFTFRSLFKGGDKE